MVRAVWLMHSHIWEQRIGTRYDLYITSGWDDSMWFARTKCMSLSNFIICFNDPFCEAPSIPFYPWMLDYGILVWDGTWLQGGVSFLPKGQRSSLFTEWSFCLIFSWEFKRAELEIVHKEVDIQIMRVVYLSQVYLSTSASFCFEWSEWPFNSRV